MKKRWLYLPIETRVRELHGKTLLACFAAVSGFDVVIGSKKDIHARYSFFPKGVVFNVGLAKNLAKNAKRYKECGHKVAAIDEEGIVTLNDDLYLRHRVSRETLGITDMFFCWGEKQASLIRGVAEGTGCELFVTGNPRFDMLRPEYRVVFNKDVEKIKNKYGKFILINTNFGHGNHFAGDDFLRNSFEEKGWMNDPRDKDFFLHNIEWQKKMFEEFQKIVPEISKNFRDRSIIIRPHPSENHDFWKKIAEKFPNVRVVHSGNVIPWLIAADVLIHNGCTTAIEAFLLGTKVIAYRPFIEIEQETELPNKISIETHNTEELIEAIRNHQDLDFGEQKKAYLDLFLAGFREQAASEGIAAFLLSEAQPADAGLTNFSLIAFEALTFLGKIKNKIFFQTDKNSVHANYQLHKTPNLSKKDIESVIGDFSKINRKFLNLEVKKIGETCHHIYEKK